jgi:hypothetical protein
MSVRTFHAAHKKFAKCSRKKFVKCLKEVGKKFKDIPKKLKRSL